jgi:hypothetical protein
VHHQEAAMSQNDQGSLNYQGACLQMLSVDKYIVDSQQQYEHLL